MSVEELSFPASTIWLDKKNRWLGVRDGKGQSHDRDTPRDNPSGDGAAKAPPQQLWPRVFPGL